MIDTTITQWVILLLVIADVLAMAMLPFVLRVVVKLELKLEDQQRQIDKLDEAVGTMAMRMGVGMPQNNRLLPPLPVKEK